MQFKQSWIYPTIHAHVEHVDGIYAVDLHDVEVEPSTLRVNHHRFAGSTVDKPLNIHRIGCAETRLLKTSRFFSNIHAGSIQSLSSQFART